MPDTLWLAGILKLSQTINQLEINDPSNFLSCEHTIAQKESCHVSGILDCRLLQTLKYFTLIKEPT